MLLTVNFQPQQTHSNSDHTLAAFLFAEYGNESCGGETFKVMEHGEIGGKPSRYCNQLCLEDEIVQSRNERGHNQKRKIMCDEFRVISDLICRC